MIKTPSLRGAKTVFIYALKDPRDKTFRYVGKTCTPKKRLRRHIKEAKKGIDETYKNRWVRSLLLIGLEPEMEILDEVPATRQNFFERAYIKIYRESGFKLTNGTDGGDGGATTTGRKGSPEESAAKAASWTPERRAAQSARLTGVRRTPEEREALSAAWTPERRAAQSLALTVAQTGVHHTPKRRAAVAASWTPERRAAQSARQTGKKRVGMKKRRQKSDQ